MDTAPTGDYWLGPLAASLGAGIVAIAVGLMLVAWLAGVSPVELARTAARALIGGDR